MLTFHATAPLWPRLPWRSASPRRAALSAAPPTRPRPALASVVHSRLPPEASAVPLLQARSRLPALVVLLRRARAVRSLRRARATVATATAARASAARLVLRVREVRSRLPASVVLSLQVRAVRSRLGRPSAAAPSVVPLPPQAASLAFSSVSSTANSPAASPALRPEALAVSEPRPQEPPLLSELPLLSALALAVLSPRLARTSSRRPSLPTRLLLASERRLLARSRLGASVVSLSELQVLARLVRLALLLSQADFRAVFLLPRPADSRREPLFPPVPSKLLA